MEQTNWHAAWDAGRIGFHQQRVHPDLRTWAARFLGDGPQRVLVPLCGKTLDLLWLEAQGHEVVGVELVAQAVRTFFEESGRTPTIEGSTWRSGSLSIVQADFFDLPDLGTFDRIWDRAALVAIDPDRRQDYAETTAALLKPSGRMLLNAFEYDQTRMSGPPWSVPDTQIRSLYEGIERLSSANKADEMPFEGHDEWWSNTYLWG